LGTRTIGEVYDIPHSVRGATLDAVASSFPELCTVVFALLAGHFDAGVGAIAGSALFNILVIPALASLAVGGMVVHASVIKRDGVFYIAVVTAFIAVFYFGDTGPSGQQYRTLPAWSGLVAVVLYLAYVTALAMQSRATARAKARERAEARAATVQGWIDDGEVVDRSVGRAVARIAAGMIGVGIACHFLVDSGLQLFVELGLTPAIAGVTVLAAATSLPDTLLSVFAARRGDADGAIANAFASNSFDILICLGVPIIVVGDLQMNWDDGWPILGCLLASSLTSVLFMISDWKLTRTESVIKLVLYLLFCAAVSMGYL
jgi:cation:H+ antiporter